MGASKIISAAAAAGLVSDGVTVGVTGAGGGLVEPDTLPAAIERRFLETGSPRMQQLVRDEKIEAYVFPAGVINGLLHRGRQRCVKACAHAV